MKIINDTTNTIQYLVTPSGTVLSGSPIIASGTINPNNTLDFPLTNAGKGPWVYVKSQEPYNQGYLSIQTADGGATVTLAMTTNEPVKK